MVVPAPRVTLLAACTILGACTPDTGNKAADSGMGSTTPSPPDTAAPADDTGSTTDTADTGEPVRTDADADGYYAEVDDCDDTNPEVHPGATDTVWTDRDCTLGSAHSLIGTHIVPADGMEFLGERVRALPDLDGDGIAELWGIAETASNHQATLIWSGATLIEGGTYTTADAILQIDTISADADDHTIIGDPLGWGSPAVAMIFPIDHISRHNIYIGNLGAMVAGEAPDFDTMPVIQGDHLEDSTLASAVVIGDYDYDGDGLKDLVVASREMRVNDHGDYGRVDIHLADGLRASPRRVPDDADVFIQGESYNDFGHTAASWGDVDGDGLADLAVGAPFTRGATLHYGSAGAVYVFTGSTTLPVWSLATDDARTTIRPPDPEGAYVRLGTEVGEYGDLTGDGQAEVFIGAPYWGPSGSGGAWLLDPTQLPAGAAGVDDTHLTIHGDHPLHQLGTRTFGGFDYDADGLADAILTDRDMGARHVYVPGSSLVPGEANLVGDGVGDHTWAQVPDHGGLGIPSADAVDLDGDGDLELILGASPFNFPETYFGGIHLLFERP